MELLECDRWREEQDAGVGRGRVDFGGWKMEGQVRLIGRRELQRWEEREGGWRESDQRTGARVERVGMEEKDKEGWEGRRVDRILGGEGRRSGGWRQVPCVSLENSHHRATVKVVVALSSSGGAHTGVEQLAATSATGKRESVHRVPASGSRGSALWSLPNLQPLDRLFWLDHVLSEEFQIPLSFFVTDFDIRCLGNGTDRRGLDRLVTNVGSMEDQYGERG